MDTLCLCGDGVSSSVAAVEGSTGRPRPSKLELSFLEATEDPPASASAAVFSGHDTEDMEGLHALRASSARVWSVVSYAYLALRRCSRIAIS